MPQSNFVYYSYIFNYFHVFFREINITLPSFTINNGSLFAHIFIGPQDLSPEIPKNYGRFKVISVPLTKYLVPSAVEFNLVTGEYEVFIIYFFKCAYDTL